MQAAGRRTPMSGAKRGRAGAEEIYGFYDGECCLLAAHARRLDLL